MYVCMYVSIYIYIYIYMYIYIHMKFPKTHMYVDMWVYIHTQTQMHEFLCMRVGICTCKEGHYARLQKLHVSFFFQCLLTFTKKRAVMGIVWLLWLAAAVT
jgi:hypothetical protein